MSDSLASLKASVLAALDAKVQALDERIRALETVAGTVDEHSRQLDELRRDLTALRGAVDRVLAVSMTQSKELRDLHIEVSGLRSELRTEQLEQRTILERVAGLLEQFVRQQTPSVEVAP